MQFITNDNSLIGYCFRCGRPLQTIRCENCGFQNSNQTVFLLEEAGIFFSQINKNELAKHASSSVIQPPSQQQIVRTDLVSKILAQGSCA